MDEGDKAVVNALLVKLYVDQGLTLAQTENESDDLINRFWDEWHLFPSRTGPFEAKYKWAFADIIKNRSRFLAQEALDSLHHHPWEICMRGHFQDCWHWKRGAAAEGHEDAEEWTAGPPQFKRSVNAGHPLQKPLCQTGWHPTRQNPRSQWQNCKRFVHLGESGLGNMWHGCLRH